MSKQRRMVYKNLWRDDNWVKIIKEKHGFANGILLISMIVDADDEGRNEIIPKYTSPDVFFDTNITADNIIEMLDNIKLNWHSIVFYSSGKRLFYQFAKWSEYQILRTDRVRKSTFPQPNEKTLLITTINDFFNNSANKDIKSTPIKIKKIPTKKTDKNDDDLLKKKEQIRKNIVNANPKKIEKLK